MYRSAVFATALALMCGAASDGQAVTINDGVVDCFGCTVDPDTGTTTIQVGDRYAVSNPSFQSPQGTQFDVLIEVLDLGAAPNLSNGTIGPFNLRGINRFVHYEISTIAPGSATTSTPDGDLLIIPGLTRVDILDIDSNSRQNFGEVAGINLPVFTLGDALERAGFENMPDAPTTGFNYVRLDPAFSGDPNSWTDEGNVPNDATHTASFFASEGVSQFEFVWGSTGPVTSDRLVRGWEIEFGLVNTPPSVVPLPAGLVLTLTGLGAFGVLRSRRFRTAHEDSGPPAS